ncbi:MAG: hypothetical protein FWF49_05485, partial [Oscillospiraceae bacterium]|nr:hypothetical protein [Oscillospiraceae bacterium]
MTAIKRIHETCRFRADEFEKLKSSLVAYRCALNIVETKLTNLNEYYMAFGDTNPIEHVTYRIKSAESIAGKLKTKGLPVTAAAAVQHLSDIAGARIICSYGKDVAEIASIIKAQDDLTVIEEKDYITNPKPSGYRSYHLVA